MRLENRAEKWLRPSSESYSGSGVAALLLTRIFEIGNIGPGPFVAAAAIVGVVALAASAVPAWRASRLSPLVALRD
jgi:ABC-type lipoprotein release transport system permease subunit